MKLLVGKEVGTGRHHPDRALLCARQGRRRGLGQSVEAAISQICYVLSTRVGSECVAHALQDPDTTSCRSMGVPCCDVRWIVQRWSVVSCHSCVCATASRCPSCGKVSTRYGRVTHGCLLHSLGQHVALTDTRIGRGELFFECWVDDHVTILLLFEIVGAVHVSRVFGSPTPMFEAAEEGFSGARFAVHVDLLVPLRLFGRITFRRLWQSVPVARSPGSFPFVRSKPTLANRLWPKLRFKMFEINCLDFFTLFFFVIFNCFFFFMQVRGQTQWGPEPDGWGAQNFAFFFSFFRRKIRSFLLSLGVFSLNSGGFLKRRGPKMCTFGVLWLSCEAPGDIWAPAARSTQHTTNQNRFGQSQLYH